MPPLLPLADFRRWFLILPPHYITPLLPLILRLLRCHFSILLFSLAITRLRHYYIDTPWLHISAIDYSRHYFDYAIADSRHWCHLRHWAPIMIAIRQPAPLRHWRISWWAIHRCRHITPPLIAYATLRLPLPHFTPLMLEDSLIHCRAIAYARYWQPPDYAITDCHYAIDISLADSCHYFDYAITLLYYIDAIVLKITVFHWLADITPLILRH
jgi:hypothetical protein